jgi:hypothetical protein
MLCCRFLCVSHGFGIFAYSIWIMVDFVNSKHEELCLLFIILNVKIYGVAQGTRPVACVLGPEVLALITRG